MKRNLVQFVITCSSLLALGSVSDQAVAYAAGPSHTAGSVSGVVRDTAGTPQIGAEVELLRADESLVSRVFTDRKGTYSFASLMPGQYALKAIGTSFIPTLKQNLRVRANTVVNLTLNTLYDLMQWTPVPVRGRERNEDDWAWTLRSAESRPLLRYLDDGSPIVVLDGAVETASAAARRRMRVAAETGGRNFDNGAARVSLAALDQSREHRRVAASGGFGLEPDGTAGVAEAMLGFRQEGGGQLAKNSVQTLAAVMVDPQLSLGSEPGVSVVSMRGWENLNLLGGLEAEAGSNEVYARVGNGDSVMAAMPFGSLKLHRGNATIAYRVATARSEAMAEGLASDALESQAENWVPVVVGRDGRLELEHGLHQELGWSTTAGPTEMMVVFYGDSIENPLLSGAGRLSEGENAGGLVLADANSGMLRAAGPGYSTTGMLASFASRLPGGNRVRLSYASGDALVMRATGTPETLAAILRGVKAHRAQMYALALAGTVDGLGTNWRASYRWQPAETMTAIAPFAIDASAPYFNVYIRQPLHSTRQGPGGVEAQLDLRNLLSEGYATYTTTDGTRLFFAQAQRSIGGGLAFTF